MKDKSINIKKYVLIEFQAEPIKNKKKGGS
jgi:hypothetical protein